MNFDRNWTIFALDAEVEAFGTSRIASAHNKLRAEVAALKKDADRYRWLSDNGMFVDFVGDPDNYVRVWHGTEPPKCQHGKTLDAAIDAALKEGS